METCMSDKEQKTEVLIEEQLDALISELNKLAQRLQAITPGYTPPAFSPRRLLAFIEENLNSLTPGLGSGLVEQLQGAAGGALFDLETWKGLWYLINYTLKLQADFVKRRFTGEYETDEWGLDWEFLETVMPLVSFMYETYWRVETSGLENIPLEGRTLLVSNHSGQLPWDGVMVGAAIWHEHPAQRLVRALHAPWFATLPFLSAVFVKMGQTVATVDNGTRLLAQEELVAVFPEGEKGLGKPYRERYQLASFGRGGFVKMALNTQAPIIPVSVVGAEETYIALANSRTLARLTGLPYFSITPTFPWLGPLGLVPLPTKWYIDFGAPIPTQDYDPDAAKDLMLIRQLTEQVREAVQEMVGARLEQRRSVFLG
jgi:1-acyl-sn-glycerol-3-phosphate acyltransferase